jgi:hypothetical protein
MCIRIALHTVSRAHRHSTKWVRVTKQGRVIFEVAPDSEGCSLIINDLVKPHKSKSAKIAL